MQIKIFFISLSYILATMFGDIVFHFISLFWEWQEKTFYDDGLYGIFSKVNPLFNGILSGYLAYKFNIFLIEWTNTELNKNSLKNLVLAPFLLVAYMLYIEYQANSLGLVDDWSNGFVIIITFITFFYFIKTYLENENL